MPMRQELFRERMEAELSENQVFARAKRLLRILAYVWIGAEFCIWLSGLLVSFYLYGWPAIEANGRQILRSILSLAVGIWLAWLAARGRRRLGLYPILLGGCGMYVFLFACFLEKSLNFYWLYWVYFFLEAVMLASGVVMLANSGIHSYCEWLRALRASLKHIPK